MFTPYITHLFITPNRVIYGLYNVKTDEHCDHRAESYCVLAYEGGVPNFDSLTGTQEWIGSGSFGGIVAGRLVVVA